MFTKGRKIFLTIIDRPIIVMERHYVALEKADKLLNIIYTRLLLQDKFSCCSLKRPSTFIDILQELNLPVFSFNNIIRKQNRK
jgi:hypothetical protein